MEKSPTAMSIFGFQDPRVRRTTVCGTAVAIVAPPIGAMGRIFGSLIEGKGMSPESIQDAVKQADVSKVFEIIPDLCIYCVRESANPKAHVFSDDIETRRMLADLPFEDAVNVMTICFELMGQDKAALAAEIKN